MGGPVVLSGSTTPRGRRAGGPRFVDLRLADSGSDTLGPADFYVIGDAPIDGDSGGAGPVASTGQPGLCRAAADISVDQVAAEISRRLTQALGFQPDQAYLSAVAQITELLDLVALDGQRSDGEGRLLSLGGTAAVPTGWLHQPMSSWFQPAEADQPDDDGSALATADGIIIESAFWGLNRQQRTEQRRPTAVDQAAGTYLAVHVTTPTVSTSPDDLLADLFSHVEPGGRLLLTTSVDEVDPTQLTSTMLAATAGAVTLEHFVVHGPGWPLARTWVTIGVRRLGWPEATVSPPTRPRRRIWFHLGHNGGHFGTTTVVSLAKHAADLGFDPVLVGPSSAELQSQDLPPMIVSGLTHGGVDQKGEGRYLAEDLVIVSDSADADIASPHVIQLGDLMGAIGLAYPWEDFAKERSGPFSVPLRVAYLNDVSALGRKIEQLLADDDAVCFRSADQDSWSNRRSLYHWADVFVGSPSADDPFYHPGVEALAAGCILVAPEVPGTARYLDAGNSSVMVRFNDPADYANQLRQMPRWTISEVKGMRLLGRLAIGGLDLDRQRRRLAAFLEDRAADSAALNGN